MNPLTGIVSPTVRRYIYAAYAFVGTALGLTAASNTPSPERQD